MKPLLMIAITILAVGCSGKDQSTTDTKPVEEKVVEVKEEAKTEEPLAETKPKPEGVNYDDIEAREKIYYLKGSNAPYTGKSFLFHENGKKSGEINYKDGKIDGLWVFWHKNGHKSQEINWKDGKKEGLQAGWHANGQKRNEVNWKDGKHDGLQLSWHKNGQKESELNYKDGKPDGFWMSWHDNGQKLAELNFKDGKIDGLEASWHKNGQKRSERNHKDGNEVEGSTKFWNSKGKPVESLKEANKK
jgi:antitoxin component YwqK of YwqJK toxin-antitoxin module